MSGVHGCLRVSAGLCLILLAALLAGEAPVWPAAIGTAQAAGDPDPVADEPIRSPSYSQDVPASAIEGARLESLLGRDFKTRDEDTGRIIDILVDRDGLVRAAVVEIGGFLGIGTRRIAVDWSMLVFDTSQKQPSLVLDMRRDQLRSAPEYKAGEPVVVFVRRGD
jgi:PRC-barrel domain